MTGNILSIERCSLHDGPGLRTTVFLKGCSLSCVWCHNPESKSFKPELFYFAEKCTFCGKCESSCSNSVHHVDDSNHLNGAKHEIIRENCIACGACALKCLNNALEIKGSKIQVKDVLDIILKDRRYYDNSGGGLTISGGEPMHQFDFALELLRSAKENNIHTCLETSGYSPTENLLSTLPYVDLYLYDYKESNESDHIEFTGVSNELIINNLAALDKNGGKIILRCPIIPGYNDYDEHFKSIAVTANSLKNIIEINVMPFNPMGSSKAKRIGNKYAIEDLSIPTDALVLTWVNAIKKDTNVPVIKGS